MFNILKKKSDLTKLKNIAENLAKKVIPGQIYLLQGELGAGKTTFTRFFIQSIYKNNLLKKPHLIRSPSFPILINYPLLNYEILHYDFYRIKKINEITELGFYENIDENVSIIEWPEIIIKNLNVYEYFLIKFRIIDLNNRFIEIKLSKNFEHNEK